MITSDGFFGSMDQDDFSRFDMGGDGMVSSSPGSSNLRVDRVVGATRRVSIQPGAARCPGVRSASDAAGTYDLPANASGSARLDWIVLRWLWNSSPGTAAFVHVQGTPGPTPAAPPLVQVAGTQWDVPLGLVRVDPGVGALPADAVKDARYWAFPGATVVQDRVVDPPHRPGRSLFVVSTGDLLYSKGTTWVPGNVSRITAPVTPVTGKFSDFGSPQLPAEVHKFSDGRCQLAGSLRRVPAAGPLVVNFPGVAIGTVPGPYRPIEGAATFPVASSIGILRLDVNRNGQLTLWKNDGDQQLPGGAFVALDGCTWVV